MNIKIEKLDNFGRGIGYLNNKIVFVSNALVGEEVIIKIIKETSKYYEADVESIIKTSPKRIKPICPYYLKCGGCNLMHMAYQDEVDFKFNNLTYLFQKKFNVKPDKIILNKSNLNYRNKITLKVQNCKYGYYKEESHEFIEIGNCLLASDAINEFIKNKNILFNDGEIIIRSNYLNELLIIVNTKDDLELKEIPNNIKGIIKNNKVIYGDDFFIEKIGDYKFKISYGSFFQVNPFIANEIFKILNENLNGDNLLDLYCGVGSLGISLAKNFKNIYGVEIVKNAIENAKENALLNGVLNANFESGDASIFYNKFDIEFDSLIVDPPRNGLNKETLNNILKIKPNTFAYVSCNHNTLMRDLELIKNDYQIDKVYVCDMFSRTCHVETICILKKL